MYRVFQNNGENKKNIFHYGNIGTIALKIAIVAVSICYQPAYECSMCSPLILQATLGQCGLVQHALQSVLDVYNVEAVYHLETSRCQCGGAPFCCKMKTSESSLNCEKSQFYRMAMKTCTVTVYPC